MNRLCIYFLLFMIYSIIGWLIELLGKLIFEHKLVNRGFLIGPYCPIYGWGGLLMTLLFKNYLNDPVVLFILIVLLCSALEYFTSYIMEKMFKLRWWDYNHFKFNINGRICLETMIPFGLAGLFVMYKASPFFLSMLEKMNTTLLYSLSLVLFIVYLIDSIISDSIINKFSSITADAKNELIKKYNNAKDNTEMIKDLVFKKIKDGKDYLNERILKSFPNMKVFDFIKKENK